MRQEMEIEFKNLLNEKDYTKLMERYNTSGSSVWQANDYFDTPTFELRSHGAALRIREKKTGLILTLKEPQDDGLLETHVSLSEQEAEDLFQYGLIHSSEMNQQLEKFELTTSLEHLGRLETERFEKQLESGLLVLDKSTYLGTTDYELEFEVTDYAAGKRAFEELLQTNEIPLRETKNKIVRFMDRKALTR
ncbi:CYTH domain-containing protein [Exiguobacterium sp. RIT594]|uniref:CYTH domain-containing protein n=1 Tax=Exiguobacterium sp. RIT594 TaxID=2282449 RepID=UPI001F28A494|nr:CYTH domain-containing protein [Exiguobacterium sp. RIT594]